jgi:hypothetical protein
VTFRTSGNTEKEALTFLRITWNCCSASLPLQDAYIDKQSRKFVAAE